MISSNKDVSGMQGRPKGGKNKSYTKEEKMLYVQQLLNGKSCRDVEKEYGVGHAVVNRWMRDYLNYGEDGLRNFKSLGFSSRNSGKKDLINLVELQRENMKLLIENEKLKMNYYKKKNNNEIKECEFMIIKNLSDTYYISSLCNAMNVSRDAYYKWTKRFD